MVQVPGERRAGHAAESLGGAGCVVGGHGVLNFPQPAGRVGSRPARTRMCARAGTTVRKHPLTVV